MQSCNELLTKIDWTCLYREPDINKKVSIYYTVLNNIVKTIPTRYVKNRPNDKPWITLKNKNLIDDR